jgi:hypothetical protein
VPLNVNMAACHLKLKQWGDVKKTCSKALEMESTNVKALFRRAQVCRVWGDGRAQLRACDHAQRTSRFEGGGEREGN